ncbi:MAG: hypothetical protein CSA72_14285 [Rhodobacterales bacterium]|nr:MAG: hypothetical protein CR993_08585 [Rhodobacterales bacterium]PIE09155.1 MAG: hypothetical protein CSA72_14285 [Rhodobacterales bacterium]
MRLPFIVFSALALVACSPNVPNSAAGARNTLPPAVAVNSRPLDAAGVLAADTRKALNLPAEGAATGHSGISDEQDFGAVSGRESIESDAQRIAANRAQFVIIEPTDLPPRPSGSGPSIVAFALATNNQPGQALYRRSSFSAKSRFDRACAKYPSADQAQQVFLDAGGPKRDPKGMDPDGDGFACYWDPRPFRAARGGASTPPQTYEVIETPGES